MKGFRIYLAAFLILALGFSLACAKKTIRSDAPVSYAPAGVEPPAGEAKPEAASQEKAAALERERKLQEEDLRQKALREKELREKALREEAARREAAAREAAAREASSKAAKLEPIFFEFDEWTIQENQKEVMVKNGEWLKAHPNVKVRLEGHCDERGTAEYNQALGQRRAEAAKAFLEGLGISPQRMTTISYGEERPLDPGHTEGAWAKNRRVDISPLP